MAPRPAKTGYERLAQADRFSDDSDDEDLSFSVNAAPGPSHHHGRARPPRHRRGSSSAGVDLKAINARLEKWADEIASKFKRGKDRRPGEEEEERLEIHHSVFRAPDGIRPITAMELGDFRPRMSKAEFEEVIEGVRTAIEQGMHPRMITQGSSGSYFARNTAGKVVGVFKPKDEEPYAAGNPKWNKWIHRNLFPCCFGRACLIPNLSYVSEAAAYTLDCQLRTNMVPYTDVVYLSSKSFHYPFWDRHSFHRKKKPLPAKPGSFQVFLTGFKDANIFLREHPWPDQYLSGYRTNDSHRKRQRRWADNCRPTRQSSSDSINSDDEGPDERPLGPDHFVWTEGLKQSFREELEKLVILDYIMRNTDRGLDNWMVKVDWETQKASITSEPMHMKMNTGEEEEEEETLAPRPVHPNRVPPMMERASNPYRVQGPMKAASPANVGREPQMSIGAIDNSLSWPWKHPDAWRSFPFGWLFLPVDLIGRPFSEKTRNHFLPLLTSTHWWSQTQHSLRKVFQLDPDFQERMFARQMAVMKGQAWNVVETLKTADHGPLELTRRAKVCVWDDLVDVPVAVPMRPTSSEVRRAERDMASSLDEVDIGAAASSAPTQTMDADLLGFASPPADMPHPGRFELTSPSGEETDASMARPASLRKAESEPEPQNGGTPRSSLQGPSGSSRAGLNMYAPPRHGHARRHSHAAGKRSKGSIAQQLYGDVLDGDEGDLGFAAAEGMEGSHRKVIVERLEMVKAKNPVFSCW
ncbi:probable LSB6 LAs17 Binding protein [Cephalotrichum gorgonifer]|uniref:Phosphatidylinositol 4-kinase n=1 Tax=Cephalotrichum gorgonifer TaxID=2041049 RepID=A0AAE8N5E8_9PEZI|nr:probable LSB6 LAs17 Binding protein [Cephalotrichum gorgonifer]